jgi:uncharacterized protein with HEPN domain
LRRWSRYEVARKYRDYLQDMLEATDKVAASSQGMTLERFLEDEKTPFAVVRGLEIIGEGAKKIPVAVKAKHPQVPWREVAGMSDKLAHDTVGVNAEVVWKTVVEDVPRIARSLRDILS